MRPAAVQCDTMCVSRILPNLQKGGMMHLVVLRHHDWLVFHGHRSCGSVCELNLPMKQIKLGRRSRRQLECCRCAQERRQKQSSHHLSVARPIKLSRYYGSTVRTIIILVRIGTVVPRSVRRTYVASCTYVVYDRTLPYTRLFFLIATLCSQTCSSCCWCSSDYPS